MYIRMIPNKIIKNKIINELLKQSKFNTYKDLKSCITSTNEEVKHYINLIYIYVLIYIISLCMNLSCVYLTFYSVKC